VTALLILAAVLYGLMLRDIAREVRGGMSVSLEHDEPLQRVCVWFGEHLIADYTADPENAATYEAAMRRRFVSLRVTSEPAGAVVDSDADRR